MYMYVHIHTYTWMATVPLSYIRNRPTRCLQALKYWCVRQTETRRDTYDDVTHTDRQPGSQREQYHTIDPSIDSQATRVIYLV
mmetsp:Transcript_36778/g.92141  ORF Transcript_36778/g.92141 Transcript_36778/m.92141 type:complete len:83 (-) Transcript_36778:588-836(-)